MVKPPPIRPTKPTELRSFLEDVLPSSGNFWLLMRRHGDGMMHEGFHSIEKLVSRVATLTAAGVDEVWHACASYEHAPNEQQPDSSNKWGRKKENVASLASFFLDIDVDPDKPDRYGTIEEAEEALDRFCDAFGIQCNHVVYSGGGLHAYWSLNEDIPCEEWQRVARKFKDATKILGLLTDPARTSDPTSTLRPVGTTNKKNKYGPSGNPVVGWWVCYRRVNFDDFDAACNRVIGNTAVTVIDNQRAPAATITSATTLAPTQPRHWFDELSIDIKLKTLRSMLVSLPVESVTNRAHWIEVGAALAGVEHIPHDTLFQLWAEWSQSTPDGASSWNEDSPEEHRSRWNDFNRSGVGALITRAKQAGWLPDTLRNDTDDSSIFQAIVEAQDVCGERWSMEQAIAYMRKHVIFVSADNQYLHKGLSVTKESLDTLLARHMPVSSERTMTASNLLKKGYGEIVDHTGYKPGTARIYIDSAGSKIANTWRPHPIESKKPTKEDARTFVDFITHLANGNTETAKGIKRIVTKYAFLYKHPSDRIRHATLLIGRKEGCGKSTLTYEIPRALFGSANVRSVETRELSSDFNSYAHGAQILVFPELWLGSRKDAQTQANNLKPLITDDYISVVKKGKDGRNVENCTTIFASSNHEDAAFFGVHDRRYDVISTDAPMMPTELATRMHSLIIESYISHDITTVRLASSMQ